MLKIRRPLGRLIFNMGIAIPGKTVFLIEMAPWIPLLQRFCVKWDVRNMEQYPEIHMTKLYHVTKPWEEIFHAPDDHLVHCCQMAYMCYTVSGLLPSITTRGYRTRFTQMDWCISRYIWYMCDEERQVPWWLSAWPSQGINVTQYRHKDRNERFPW